MSQPTLRIASYNLQKCVGLDLRRRPERSLAVIKATGADMVVLQEADKRLPPRPAALPHAWAEAEGWTILPFGAPNGSLGWHGNAMLVRGYITATETAHLELPGLEPRGAIRAELQSPIGPLRVIGVHLGLIKRFRLLQLATIRRALHQLPPKPTIIAGDFNEWGRGAALEAAMDDLSFIDMPPSFPATRPIGRLDRMLISAELSVRRAGALSERPAHIASDHRPVWADISAG